MKIDNSKAIEALEQEIEAPQATEAPAANAVKVTANKAITESVQKALELLKHESDKTTALTGEIAAEAGKCWHGIKALFFTQLDADNAKTGYASTEVWKAMLASESKAANLSRGVQYASNLARAYKLARVIKGGVSSLPQELRTMNRVDWNEGESEVTINGETKALKEFWAISKGKAGAKAKPTEPKATELTGDEQMAIRAELNEKAGDVAEFINQYMQSVAKRYDSLTKAVKSEFENECNALLNRLEKKSRDMQGGQR